jgi:hypothetical protein
LRRWWRYRDAPAETKKRLAEQRLPSHPMPVLVVTAAAALIGFLAKQTYGFDTVLGCCAAILIGALALCVLVIIYTADSGSDHLPEQKQLGDAHCATLDEVRQRTALFNQDNV